MQDAYGVITFPTSLTFESDALGVTYRGEIEGNPMSLTLPLLGDTEEGPWATSPRPDLEILDLVVGRGAGFGWSDGGAWHSERKRVTRVSVNAAYFEGTTPGPDDAAGHNAEIAATYGQAFHTWYSKVISWLSVWTGFDLRPPLRPDEGPSAHLEFSTNGGSGFHPPMYGDFTSRGITATEFRGAITRASAGEDPALAWRYFLDAQRSRDRRRSVIDAATAAEVAVETRTFELFASRASFAAEQAQTLLWRNGISAKLRLLEVLLPPGKGNSLQNDVEKAIAAPRNNAVHSGVEPDRDVGTECLSAAKRVLERHSPLPAP